MFREKCKTVHQIAQLYRHSKETDQRFDFTIYDRMRLAHKKCLLLELLKSVYEKRALSYVKEKLCG